MFTIFISHQWLDLHHPDPDGLQLQVLQRTLRNVIARKLKIESDIVSHFYGRPPKAALEQIQGAYLWLDYFCVPQLVDGHGSPGLAEEQLRYVHSIPSYVELCNLFLALVPTATHRDTRSACSFNSWLQRGWCRTELWCHFLSARSKAPIVVVKSHDAAIYTAPLWHQYPVGMGDFALDEDRKSCNQIIRVALNDYLSELRESKNKTAFRLYLSLFEDLTGLPRKRRSFEEFLAEFSFAKPVRQYRGLGPIACGALSGLCGALLPL